MSALDLLRRLYVAGVDVGLNADGGIQVTRNPPPPDLLAELKDSRAEVIAELQAHDVGKPDPVMTYKRRRYVAAPDCIAPNACACLGPCSRWLTRQPCEYRKGRAD